MAYLNKGLKFVRKPFGKPKQSVKEGLLDFKRRMRLKVHFGENKSNRNPIPRKFRNKSSYYPDDRHPVLEKYLSSVTSKFIDWTQNENTKTKAASYSYRNRILKIIKRNRKIVVKKQDKGSAVVLINRDLYVQKGYEFLENASYFQEIQNDSTAEIADLISTKLKQGLEKAEISQELFEFLDPIKNNCTRLANLYFLPKMHKNPIKVRPIVSANNTPTERVGIFLDFFLQPLILLQKTYLKDSKQVIQKIESQTFPLDCTLMTLDVTSLYTNIDHNLALQQIANRLSESEVKQTVFRQPSNAFLTELADLLIRNNIFEFNRKIFKQTIGLAMGNVAAPAISDLVLYDLELKLIEFLGEKKLFYGRYRDDILIITKGDENIFLDTLKFANTLSDLIKFEGASHGNSVEFLDLVIFKGKRFESNNILDIRIKEKPFGTNAFLHRSSSHPRGVFKGLITGEVIRSVRNNSDEEYHRKRIQNLSKNLIARGYSHVEINAVSSSIPYKNRTKYLSDNSKNKEEQTNFLPFIFQWFPGCSYLKKFLEDDWQLIRNDPQLSQLFPVSPTLVFKRGTNLADKLVSAKLK